MNNGDKMRQMNNQELAEEIWRWHDVLFGTEFRFVTDIENFLNEEIEEAEIFLRKDVIRMKDCGRCFYNDSMSRTCGDDLCHKCNHCLYVDRTYKNEWIGFCDLTDEFKNITLGECLGNCKNQIIYLRKD